MRCWIYKSTRHDGMYLYVKEHDEFADVPDALLVQMGPLELVMELELHPGRRLARVEVRKVMESLQARGYFLQMPPPREHAPGGGEG